MPKSTAGRVPTFHSYISNVANYATKLQHGRMPEEEDFAGEIEVHPAMLLPGEVVVQRVEGVLRYAPHTKFRHGVSGSLICTNFKVGFVDSGEKLASRSQLISDDDIALNNISSVYQISHGRRKKLLPGNTTIGHVKHLEIHCKDFRTYTFNLKAISKQKAKLISTAIVHHAFPGRLELLFLFDYKGDLQSSCDVDHSMDIFTELQAKEKELGRFGDNGFRVTRCNEDFRISLRLPECLVLPSTLDPSEIRTDAIQFIDHRLPMWSYTHSNGVSLVRMGYTIPEAADAAGIEKRMRSAIASSHPLLHFASVIDLTQLLPSLTEITLSYDKLRELCMPVSLKEVWLTDITWYSSLQQSGWLSVVSSCLQVAQKAVEQVVKYRKTVILKERECSDLVAVVTSLAQLMMDSEACSQQGFEALVEREWVTLGHRFTGRLGLVSGPDTTQCPLLLLFLDCVWQLQRRCPRRCQLTSTYLVSVWDAACLGIFSELAFSSAHLRQIAARRSFSPASSAPPPPLLSAWQWGSHLRPRQTALFTNPLYTSGGAAAATAVDLKWGVASLRLWADCYLRWVAPLQVECGGDVARCMQQRRLADDVDELRQRLARLRAELAGGCPASDGSRLVAGAPPRTFTSSYPFMGVMRHRHAVGSLSRFPSACESEDSIDDSDDGLDSLELTSSSDYRAAPAESRRDHQKQTPRTTTLALSPARTPSDARSGSPTVRQLISQVGGQLNSQLLQQQSPLAQQKTTGHSTGHSATQQLSHQKSPGQSATQQLSHQKSPGHSATQQLSHQKSVGHSATQQKSPTVSSLRLQSSPSRQPAGSETALQPARQMAPVPYGRTESGTWRSGSRRAAKVRQEGGQPVSQPWNRKAVSPPDASPVKLIHYAALPTDDMRRSPARQTGPVRVQTERAAPAVQHHRPLRIQVSQGQLTGRRGSSSSAAGRLDGSYSSLLQSTEEDVGGAGRAAVGRQRSVDCLDSNMQRYESPTGRSSPRGAGFIHTTSADRLADCSPRRRQDSGGNIGGTAAPDASSIPKCTSYGYSPQPGCTTDRVKNTHPARTLGCSARYSPAGDEASDYSNNCRTAAAAYGSRSPEWTDFPSHVGSRLADNCSDVTRHGGTNAGAYRDVNARPMNTRDDANTGVARKADTLV